MSKLQEMTEVQRIAKELDGVILNVFDLSKELQERAKQNNVVIAWGESDDLLELRGAIDDEIGAWNGTTILVSKDGLFHECESECEHSQVKKKECVEIELIWNNEAKPLEPTWYFKTTIPHEKFNIFEVLSEKELFCEGIVFCLDAIGEQREQ